MRQMPVLTISRVSGSRPAASQRACTSATRSMNASTVGIGVVRSVGVRSSPMIMPIQPCASRTTQSVAQFVLPWSQIGGCGCWYAAGTERTPRAE